MVVSIHTRTHLVVIRRTDEACRYVRRPDLGVVAPSRTGNLFPRPSRAVVPHRALETPVLFDGRGRGGNRGAEADVSSGADVADLSVWVGSVSARRALLYFLSMFV